MQKANTNLIGVVVLCMVLAVAAFGFTLRTWIAHGFLTDIDPDKQPLVRTVRVLTFMVIPAMGGGFAFVGAVVWGSFRKNNPDKE
jgi:hypothetical protein